MIILIISIFKSYLMMVARHPADDDDDDQLTIINADIWLAKNNIFDVDYFYI